MTLKTKPRAAAHSCAHCGDGIDTRSLFLRVCAGCLARHHPGCWRASNGCARCRDSLALRHPDAKSEGSQRLRVLVLVIGILLAGTLAHLTRVVAAGSAERDALHERVSEERDRVGALTREVERLRDMRTGAGGL